MICKNNKCKAELPDDATFCLKCGAKQDIPKEIKLPTETNDSSNENTKNATKTIAIIIVSFLAVVALLYLIFTISNNDNLYTKETIPTTTAPTIVKHDYPMESCPIEITDIVVGSDDTISFNYISAQWKYIPVETKLSIDKIIFTFTIYDDGKVSYISPKRFTAQGPFSADIVYKEKWQSAYFFEDANIEKIEIFYTDNLIENYTVTEPETEAPTQPKTTKPKVNKPRTNTLENCPIKVNSYYTTYPNSADGVSFYIDWYSTDEEEIKYIYFTVTPYNRVDDKQYCEIRDHSSFNGKVTGPFYYGSADYSYWECAWYNSDIDYMTLDKITIEYMDGTKSSYY